MCESFATSVSPSGNVEVSTANNTADHGGSVSINCTAGGGPDSMFAWLRNGTNSFCFDCSSVPADTTTDVESNHYVICMSIVDSVLIHLSS